MSKVILYLLEASASLIVLYSMYQLVLNKLTFFSFNRFFLIGILVFSLVIPLLSIDLWPTANPVVDQPVVQLRDMRLAYYQAFEDWDFVRGGTAELIGSSPSEASTSVNLKKICLSTILIIYLVGVIVLVSRTLWTFVWIRKLKNDHPYEVIGGVLVVKVRYPIPPFSFWKAVFVHEESLQDESFQQILAHEKTHINQHHSIDLIFVQLIAAFLWFNPVVWRLIKSLKATHEYIVDKQMINQGYSLVEYQTLLLRQLISNNSYGLVHNFNLSFIKKRITMMKLKESGMAGKAKVVAVFAAVLVFSLVVVQCNSKLEESEVLLESPSLMAPPPPPIELPQVANSGQYRFDLDLSNSMTFAIDDDVIRVNGQVSSLEDAQRAINEPGINERTIMVLYVNKNQKMGLVRDLQDVFRKNNRNKIIYKGIGGDGQALDMAIMLPPHPDSPEGADWPKIDDEFAKRTGTEILKVKVSDNLGIDNTKLVTDMVSKHLEAGDANYVVSYKSEDSDSYGDFFSNLFYINQGFNQIYEERAQKLYDKSFFEIDRKAQGGNEQYNAVREGIPRAISIAERD
ncbi:M56 family metallopeptidase [Marinoscillum pacificum]|uniref:M56 family metallopeptidase n=1 Tax=Marinoscillum pacificum TaxID=392723 RepID=UPI00215783E4|nr:M56 family metallopeptidase [Marinoscillum pacificum]